MSVVVQIMVEPEAAGVLFTRHPLNGDPRVMVITANYGLGESVVSAKSDPDTFYVRRYFNEEVKFLGTKLGEKKIIIKMDAKKSTVEVECDRVNKGKSCIKEENVIRIAKLGIAMEKLFGSPRDIEFAVRDDKIFLLQSRPITSLNNYSDFEIEHERDNVVMGDCFVCTRANVGEVLQGPSTSFGQSNFTDSMEDLMMKIMKGKQLSKLKAAQHFMPIFSHYQFMNVAMVSFLRI